MQKAMLAIAVLSCIAQTAARGAESTRLAPTASERCGAHGRRPFHDDEARQLQMLDKSLGDDARHDLARVADALSAAVAHRIGERLGEVFGRGGREVDGARACPNLNQGGEQRKNVVCASVGGPSSRSIARYASPASKNWHANCAVS